MNTATARRRVVVTGLGVVTPLGNDIDTLWQALLAGRSGIGTVSRFSPRSREGGFIAGEVADFRAEDHVGTLEAARYDRHVLFAVAAARRAFDDASPSGIAPERAGVIVGTGFGGITTHEEQATVFQCKGARRVSPYFVPMILGNMAAGIVASTLGLRGPCHATASACASGAQAILSGRDAILLGHADLMVCGGSESAITPMVLEGFGALNSLSRRHGDPARASRPFDRERDGFVVAEGAGIVVLEDRDHALVRGARIHGELVGGGASADAHHITAMPEDGEGARLAMAACLRDARIAPEAVDYVNAHGSSTPLNDRAETVALKRLFGAHAARLRISSTKSMLGHMLGAAGAVEAIIALLAVKHGAIPPTINLTVPDPDCDLDYCPNQAVLGKVGVALSNSFGFGGQNVCLAFADQHQEPTP